MSVRTRDFMQKRRDFMQNRTEVNRRDFLRFGALAAAGTVPALRLAQAAPVSQAYFGLHPAIEQNPKAVFIRRTNVAHKMDGPAKLREGLSLSRQIFVPMDKPG